MSIPMNAIFTSKVSLILTIALLWSISLAAQTYTIKGVVQSTDGEPLIGATVAVI